LRRAQRRHVAGFDGDELVGVSAAMALVLRPRNWPPVRLTIWSLLSDLAC
jgi:hypothetical protein